MEVMNSYDRVRKGVKNAEMIQHGDDSGIWAQFDDEIVYNEERSKATAKAEYDSYVQIELVYPGNNLTTFRYRFPMSETEGFETKAREYIERFPKQWQAFLNKKEQTPDGMPIEMWPPLDKRRVLELKSNRIYTVEQLAALTDGTGPNIGLDWRKLREMAKATLKPNDSTVAISALNKKLDDQANEIQALRNQLAMKNTLGEPETEKPRRGPKPKIKHVEEEV